MADRWGRVYQHTKKNSKIECSQLMKFENSAVFGTHLVYVDADDE